MNDLWEKEPLEGTDLIRVETSEQLANALGQATPGITIIIADGIYDYAEGFSISAQATLEAPITIRAANLGKAVLTGQSCLHLDHSSYIIIKGLKFTNTGKAAIVLNQCNHVRITRNAFALKEDGTELQWLIIKGESSHHHWIDHNDFGPRRDKGMYVSSNGGNGQMSQYDVYEYNYFHESGPSFPRSEGEIKALRIGLSGVSMSDGYNIIQHNLFVHCDANPEIISLKSCRNEVRNNTFIDCEGHLTSRHGHFNRFYNNFFIGDGKRKGMGGFRIYGNDHQIYNNEFENLTDWAVNIDGGGHDGGAEGNVYTKEVLTAHWRVYSADVFDNRIVNGPGVIIGKSKIYEPVDCKVHNNIFRSSDRSFITQVMGTNTVIEGNIQESAENSLREKQSANDRYMNSPVQGIPLTIDDVGPYAP